MKPNKAQTLRYVPPMNGMVQSSKGPSKLGPKTLDAV